ncbi:caspase family protein [Streptomyces sp. S9]|nr:caspase family protein [Streptomyces sp. S9]
MEELDFVASRMADVQWAFEPFGVRIEPPCLNATEGEIDALLRRRLVDDRDPADVTVVHLIGHGRRDRNGRLGLVAHDDRVVDVDRWIEKAQQEIERDGNRRRVVFLVDTCSAGAATGRQSLAEQNIERGVWALGATISSLPTEQGRFSHWITTALQQIRDADYTLNDDSVNFTEFVRQLISVGRQIKPSWRISLGFNLEQGDGDWPFLPNPKKVGLTADEVRMQRRSLGYVPGEEDLRKDLGTRIAAGEEVDDAVYFYDRASGRGLVSASGTGGFFSGRTAELRRYMEWQAGDGPLLTVTGAAGSGKSGLLGLIVCAAHPELRDRCHELWTDAGPGLPEVPDVVAVHARQRSGQQLIDRIVRLADLVPPKEDERESREGKTGKAEEQEEVRWTPDLLRSALKEEGKKRLVVIDAVDESSDPQSVLDLVAVLVAPENRRDRASTAPCRVLFGGRREVVDALYFNVRMAELTGEGIDLDSADPAATEEDVRRYIERLLRTAEPYTTGPSAGFVELLAKLGARKIVGGLRRDSPWGPFLLAGLYAHYLLTVQTLPTNEALARAYGGQASADLPQLLEAVLTEHPAARAVLAVLARSKGDGMPRVTLRRCLAALNAHEITDAELEKTLREASPYLRTGADRESKTLYRIFQQGLADYLRDHPYSSDPVDERGGLTLERNLLSKLVEPFVADPAGGSADRWHPAEPYVLQHALGHIMAADAPEVAETLLTDPYFLIRFDPREDHRAIDLCHSERAAVHLRLLSASWQAHRDLRSAADRAAVFLYDADRLDLPEERALFTGILAEVALQPEEAAYSLRWAVGGQVDDSSQFIETAAGFSSAMALSPGGGLLAISSDMSVQLLETETWRQVTRVPATSLGAPVNRVVFSPDGRFVAFSASTWTRNIQLWDLHNRVLLGRPWEEGTCRTGTPGALAFSPDGRMLAVASRELDVSVWDVGNGGPVEAKRLPASKEAYDLQFSPDGRLLAVCGAEGTTLWHVGTWEPVSLTHLPTLAVAFSPDGGLLALLHEDTVTLWSHESLRRTGRIALHASPSVRGLTFSHDGPLLAVTGWSTVQIIDAAAGELVGQVDGVGHIRGAFFHPAHPALLLTCHSDGRLRLWKRFTKDTDVPPLPRFHSIDAVASPDGRLVAAVDQDDEALHLYDSVTGRRLESVHIGPSSPSPDLYFSPDSRTVVATAGGDRVHVVRLGQTSPTNAVLRIGSPYSLSFAFSPDSRRFALCGRESGSEAYAIRVWDVATLRLTHRIPLPDSPDALEFSGPERLLAAINGGIAVYDCPPTLPEEEPLA